MKQDLNAIIRHITVPDGQDRLEVFDKDTSGLGLRVTTKGSKTFFYRYRFGDKIKRYTIGQYHAKDLTVADARKKVRQLRAMVESGEDPQGFKQQKKSAEQPKLVKDLAILFKTNYLPRKKPSTRQDYTSRIDTVIIPKFGKVPIDNLTTQMISSVLDEIGKTKPVHANRVQSILSRIFTYAIKLNYIGNNPVRGIEKFKESIDEYEYTHNDIRLIWKAIELEGEPNKSLMKVLLLTGQRLGETSRMKWSDLNGDEWIIPSVETKSGKSHIVPLGPMTRGVINSMKMISGASDYVFESQATPGQPIQYLQKTKKRIAEKSNVSTFKIHHLRRIVATEMIKDKIDVTHVGRVLNHSQLSKSNTVTIKHYNKHEYKPEKREALLKWEEILCKIITHEDEL